MPSGIYPHKNAQLNSCGTKNTSDQPSVDGLRPQDTAGATSPAKVKRRKNHVRHNRNNHITLAENVVQDQSSLAPSTPSPEMSQQEDFVTMQGRSSNSIPTKKHGRNKKKSIDPQVTTNVAGEPLSSSTPKRKISPRMESRTNSSTPIKTNGTPSQAYAGPTFHASPAPSALPIPKFYSRSVPESNRGVYKAMMDGNVSEESLDGSESSPTLRTSQKTAEPQAREDTPLKMFFDAADRDEEVRRKKQAPQTAIATDDNAQETLPFPATPSWSGSPIPKHIRHHSPHAIDSTTGGIFPLDISDAEKPNLSTANSVANHDPSNDLSRIAPSNLSVPVSQTTDQHRAKVGALRQPLPSQPQCHQNTAKQLHLTSQSAATHSLSTSSSPSRQPLLRSASSTSTPTSCLKTPSKDPTCLQNSYDYPLFKQPLTPTARHSPLPSTPYSPIGQESEKAKASRTAELPELAPPAPTPALSLGSGLNCPAMSQNNRNVDLNRGLSSFRRTYTPEIRNNFKSTSNRDSTYLELMEHNLRRMLKIDPIASDGATGVRS
ncbi:hypothetical protein MMC06_003647 [Schaereria dolodes]|nr:hypothetical protein [Schaereria dolodes]